MLKNKCCSYVIIHIRLFSITICNLLIDLPSYYEIQEYTVCPRRNAPNFGRVFLMLNYTDITQNTYIQSWTVTEIMAREVYKT